MFEGFRLATIDVNEAFLHCQVLTRSRLWAADSRVDRKEMPSLS